MFCHWNLVFTGVFLNLSMFSLLLMTGTEEGKVLNVAQLAESATAQIWCTLSLTLMISRIRVVFQKLLADTDAYWNHPKYFKNQPRSPLLGRSWWWLTFLPPGSNYTDPIDFGSIWNRVSGVGLVR